MSNRVKKEIVPELDVTFSSYQLQEIILETTLKHVEARKFYDEYEVSEECIEIDEIQIGKIYLCL